MIPFLKQVADHFYNAGEIDGRCFVFPNRRSMVFFRKYLCDAVAGSAEGRPLVAPQMFTINDLFFKISGAQSADRVRLLLELYECYRKLNSKAEPLDEFIFWGDVILGDFDDVDKYLVDPGQLFANVSDYRQLQDTFSYLTPVQRAAIEGFLSHFNDRSGRLTVNMDTDSPDVKGRFLLIWNILHTLYADFNRCLDEKGMAYDGKVYRSLAERLLSEPVCDVFAENFPEDTRFVFVGLNALNECEKTLLRKLRDAGAAQFCWDYSGDMISNPQNRSSVFMSENVREFPQAAKWDGELPLPQVNVVSVASAVGQAKRIPDILRQIAASTPDGRLTDIGTDCAVVLPDEGLLLPVLNSIPEEIRDINVTMGLPMSGSQLYAMMSDIAAMQLHLAFRQGKWCFYHRQVWNLFSGSLFRMAADEATQAVVSGIKEQAKYYIPQEDLAQTPLLETVFRVAVKDPKSPSSEQIKAFSEYLKDVIKAVAPHVRSDGKAVLELEYAKEYYRSVNMLQEKELKILPVTFVRLLSQLLAPVSVPFKGEPLKGLQIMGPLETRALDFRNIIILSANEGIFPRRSVSSSFIPPELRKGFGLPTYEYQDAVWAYYFYRMISRAENVWMLTDSRTEGLKSGEESRYIKQLEYHFGLPLKRYVVKYGNMKAASLPEIRKTEEDVAKIRETALSATAVQNYLACPAKFYYGMVKGLQAAEEVSESLDYGMFGTVYHEVMRSIYTSEAAMAEDFSFSGTEDKGRTLPRLGRISRDYIRQWLSREDAVKRKVRALIMAELNAMEVTGRNLVVTDVIVKYVMKTLQRDLELLEAEGTDSFEILGSEIRVAGELHGLRFKGFVDRLDSFAPGKVRVVDYKTGRVLEDDENIHDGNAEAIADKIFAPRIKDRPKIALQFFIYDMLVQTRPEVQGRDIYNCVYSTAKIFKDAPVSVPCNALFCDAVSERLKTLLGDMCDIDVPFSRTEDRKVCSYCDFRTICGR